MDLEVPTLASIFSSLLWLVRKVFKDRVFNPSIKKYPRKTNKTNCRGGRWLKAQGHLYARMVPRVQTPGTHIKGWLWPHVPALKRRQRVMEKDSDLLGPPRVHSYVHLGTHMCMCTLHRHHRDSTHTQYINHTDMCRYCIHTNSSTDLQKSRAVNFVGN